MDPKPKTKRKTPKKAHNLVVIELAGEKRRPPGKPHLYVLRTQRSPDSVFQDMVQGKGPKWIAGTAKALRRDLVPNYKPTLKREVAEVRLQKLKLELARRGFAINGDISTWRVYVLDVDADAYPPLKNRGKLGKVVYVGQTSATLNRRVAQHQGSASGKSGRFIGAPSVAGRNPTLNQRLTPRKILYTEVDAKLFETRIHQNLEKRGFRVLGDVKKD